MKKFILKSILFVIVVLIIFYFLDKLVTKGLRQSNMIMFDNLTKIFNGQINADIIINGNSKAYVQISPKIMDSILNLSTYNLGLDGTDFIPQRMQYELYEKFNNTPKIIIQVVDFETLAKPGGDLYNYIKFAPYLDIDIVRKTTKLYNGFSFIDYYLPFFKYTGKPIEVIDGIFSFLNIHLAPSQLYKGYLEQNMTWDGNFEKFKKTYKTGITVKLNKTTCNIFENYIMDCKKKNILVFLVYPPVYFEFFPYDNNRNIVREYFINLSKKYKVHYLDFYADKISLNKKLFYNSQHLNKQGVELFTTKLSNTIKHIYNRKK